MIFPPFIIFGLEILGEKEMTAFQKMSAFYTSPLSKFTHGMVCTMEWGLATNFGLGSMKFGKILTFYLKSGR